MIEFALFFIHLYLRSEKTYYEEHERYLKHEMSLLASYSGRSTEEERKRVESDAALYDAVYWWPPWKYNDLVGYVEVLYSNGDFRAELYQTNLKRVSRDPRHRRGIMVWKTWRIAESPSWVRNVAGKPDRETQSNNEDLKRGLLAVLSQIRAYSQKKRWYIDTQYWEDLVNCLDCDMFIRKRQTLHS